MGAARKGGLFYWLSACLAVNPPPIWALVANLTKTYLP